MLARPEREKTMRSSGVSNGWLGLVFFEFKGGNQLVTNCMVLGSNFSGGWWRFSMIVPTYYRGKSITDDTTTSI